MAIPPRALLFSSRGVTASITMTTKLPYATCSRFLSVIHRHNLHHPSSSHLVVNRCRNRLPLSHLSAPFSSQSANDDGETQGPVEPNIKNDMRSSLFPRALPDPNDRTGEAKKIEYPKTFAGWKRAFMNAWRDYKSTWEGFRGGATDDDDSQVKKQQAKSEMEAMVDEQKEVIQGNVERNTEFIQREAPKFFDFVQQETKIYTKEDLKQWAGEQLKLATLCVNEFMGGYRSGRDGEMDKMINEYFQEEGDEVEDAVVRRKRRRKPKRLVRSA